MICFEGIDHSGKSTQAELLRENLVGSGHDAIIVGQIFSCMSCVNLYNETEVWLVTRVNGSSTSDSGILCERCVEHCLDMKDNPLLPKFHYATRLTPFSTIKWIDIKEKIFHPRPLDKMKCV